MNFDIFREKLLEGRYPKLKLMADVGELIDRLQAAESNFNVLHDENKEVTERLRCACEKIEIFKEAITAKDELITQLKSKIEELEKQEPSLKIRIHRNRQDGTPEPTILKFVDVGDGEHEFYAKPIPAQQSEAELASRQTNLSDAVANALRGHESDLYMKSPQSFHRFKNSMMDNEGDC